MANVDALGLQLEQTNTGEYGNKTTEVATVVVNAANPAAVGDVLRFVRLPKYATITDVQVIANQASVGEVTLGFAEVDAEGDSDADYFAPSAVLGADTRVRAPNGAPLYLANDDAYITATVGVADIAADTEITVTVDFVYRRNGHS